MSNSASISSRSELRRRVLLMADIGSRAQQATARRHTKARSERESARFHCTTSMSIRSSRQRCTTPSLLCHQINQGAAAHIEHRRGFRGNLKNSHSRQTPPRYEDVCGVTISSAEIAAIHHITSGQAGEQQGKSTYYGPVKDVHDAHCRRRYAAYRYVVYVLARRMAAKQI